jgi:hypothetical protein
MDCRRLARALRIYSVKHGDALAYYGNALRVRFETLRRGVQEQRCSLFRDFKVPIFQTFCRSGRLILTGLSGFRNGLLVKLYRLIHHHLNPYEKTLNGRW